MYIFLVLGFEVFFGSFPAPWHPQKLERWFQILEQDSGAALCGVFSQNLCSLVFLSVFMYRIGMRTLHRWLLHSHSADVLWFDVTILGFLQSACCEHFRALLCFLMIQELSVYFTYLSPSAHENCSVVWGKQSIVFCLLLRRYGKAWSKVHRFMLTTLSDLLSVQNNFEEGMNGIVCRSPYPVVVGPGQS